jgi:RimJ/RimL family protein N-acetyltransferase
MDKKNISVREIEQKDIQQLADYWYKADAAYLAAMGVDVTRMPDRSQFIATLETQTALPYTEKRAYALVWEVDGKAIGHSNLNPVTYGENGFMHLHIWDANIRKMGYGLEFIKMSIPYYFQNFKLKKLCCEPYALNPAPNRTLEKAGFTFIKNYVTRPGVITFEQPVNLWEMAP